MNERSAGDGAQTRAIAEQVAEVAIAKFVENHPEVRRGTVVAEIPAPLKWAAVIFSAILTMSASAGLIWLVTSVSSMTTTLVRLDERLAGYVSAQDARIGQLERRTDVLEAYHRQTAARGGRDE